MHFTNSSLYERVIGVTQEYLGPVSKCCIDRQIIHHLDKRPDEIDENDLKLLVSWVEALTALLTGDKQVSRELTVRLESLAQKQRAGL